MKSVKRSVAVVVRRPGGGAQPGGAAGPGEFLVVRRPDDPADPLGGAWGLPAITLRDGEDERGAVIRAGRVKLGVELAPGRLILNPGSVGQPRGKDPRAAWLLLDFDAGSGSFRRSDYPLAATQAAIRARGLPEALAARLALGV